MGSQEGIALKAWCRSAFARGAARSLAPTASHPRNVSFAITSATSQSQAGASRDPPSRECRRKIATARSASTSTSTHVAPLVSRPSPALAASTHATHDATTRSSQWKRTASGSAAARTMARTRVEVSTSSSARSSSRFASIAAEENACANLSANAGCSARRRAVTPRSTRRIPAALPTEPLFAASRRPATTERRAAIAASSCSETSTISPSSSSATSSSSSPSSSPSMRSPRLIARRASDRASRSMAVSTSATEFARAAAASVPRRASRITCDAAP